MTDAKFDVYSHVTEQIIAQIEAGTPPWRKPWTGGAAGAALPMRWNGEAYRGINILMLWAMAAAKGYSSERWMTFKQAQELGGHVRKGEKSSTVVKFGTVEREDENGEERQIPYARAYRVFNADQIEGLADEVLRAGLQRAQLLAGLRREHDHRQVGLGAAGLQALHHRKAVHYRHLQVQQNQVVAVRAVQAAHRLRVHGGTQLGVACLKQQLFEQLHIGGLVVHNQNTGGQNINREVHRVFLVAA